MTYRGLASTLPNDIASQVKIGQYDMHRRIEEENHRRKLSNVTPALHKPVNDACRNVNFVINLVYRLH